MITKSNSKWYNSCTDFFKSKFNYSCSFNPFLSSRATNQSYALLNNMISQLMKAEGLFKWTILIVNQTLSCSSWIPERCLFVKGNKRSSRPKKAHNNTKQPMTCKVNPFKDIYLKRKTEWTQIGKKAVEWEELLTSCWLPHWHCLLEADRNHSTAHPWNYLLLCWQKWNKESHID